MRQFLEVWMIIPCFAAWWQVEANPEKPSAVTAVGTLQNLAAESNANKEAIREAGGIPVLTKLIKDWPDTLVNPISLPTHEICLNARSLSKDISRNVFDYNTQLCHRPSIVIPLHVIAVSQRNGLLLACA